MGKQIKNLLQGKLKPKHIILVVWALALVFLKVFIYSDLSHEDTEEVTRGAPFYQKEVLKTMDSEVV